jgi:ATP-binding cassette subfamily A (ABC1) protein 3
LFTLVGCVLAGLGLCPQHDVLFPYLTVREHLELFGGMKGIPAADIPRAVSEIIVTVGLSEKVGGGALR